MIRQTVGDGGEINMLKSVMSKPYYSILCRKIIFSNCTVQYCMLAYNGDDENGPCLVLYNSTFFVLNFFRL